MKKPKKPKPKYSLEPKLSNWELADLKKPEARQILFELLTEKVWTPALSNYESTRN